MRLRIWIEGARPKTWIASLAPVIIGTAIAYNYGSVSKFTFCMILLTAIFLQIGTNLANDYFDARKGSEYVAATDSISCYHGNNWFRKGAHLSLQI